MSLPQYGEAQCHAPTRDYSTQLGSWGLGPGQKPLPGGFSKEGMLSQAPQTRPLPLRQTAAPVRMGWEFFQAGTAASFSIAQESRKGTASEGTCSPASGEVLACSAVAWAW